MPETKRFGDLLPDWRPPVGAPYRHARGQYAGIEPLDATRHASELFRANSVDDSIWDYLPYGPFHSAATYHKWVTSVTVGASDPLFYAIRESGTGRAAGVASFLRITPTMGSIEVGHINLSPALQGTRAATEAMYLMMRQVFGAGFRRYEWKCDALNLPSRRAAQRLGFSFEGVFRQAAVYKGRNRDTAWFAITDKEWPALQSAFQAWLAPSNFDATGQQLERLSDLTCLVRVADDPEV